MIKFIKETIRHPHFTGAIAPASKYLAKKMLNNIDFSNIKVIVEYGPGTGTVTKEILEKISPSTLYIGIEINKSFYKYLIEKYPKVYFYNDSVENVGKYLRIHKKDHIDLIISGLPWANFKPEYQDLLIRKMMEVLSKNGIFITYAYLIGLVKHKARYFHKQLRIFFKGFRLSRIIWLNIPAAIIYICENKKN